MGVLGKERTQNTGGLPSAFRKEHPVGTTFAGKIVDAKVRQRTDDDGNLQTWQDGNPQEELVIAIQTDLRDPERDGDEGVRGIYIKWWGDQRRAILEALDKAGAEDIEVGGQFAAQRVGQGDQPKDPRYSRPWLYAFEYKPPAALGASLLGATPAPAAVPAPPAAVPAPPSANQLPPQPPPPPADPLAAVRQQQALLAPFVTAGWTVAQLAALPAGQIPGLPLTDPTGQPLNAAALQAIVSFQG